MHNQPVQDTSYRTTYPSRYAIFFFVGEFYDIMFQILIQEIKFNQTLIGIIHEHQNFTLVYFYEKI